MELLELDMNTQTYLSPVVKWRIIDIPSLAQECDLKTSHSNFCRLFRSLEKKGIVGSYRKPGGGRKFIFLTPKGEKLMALTDNPTAVTNETIIHDLKVSEVGRHFLNQGWITSCELEHEIHNKRSFGSVDRVVPDARFLMNKSGKATRMAFELELTVKSHARSEEKVRQYLANSPYDSVMYLFSKESHMANFRRMLIERIGESELRPILFFWWDWKVPLKEIVGLAKGKPVKLVEVFGECQTLFKR